MKTKNAKTKKPYVWKRKLKEKPKDTSDSTPKEKKGLFAHLKKEKKGQFKHLKKESKIEEWIRIKKEIEPFFVYYNLLEYCELKLEGCMIRATDYAHSLKRIDWAKEDPQRTVDAKQVVRACPKCHHTIEYPHVDKEGEESGRQLMFNHVVAVIRRRNVSLGLNPDHIP